LSGVKRNGAQAKEFPLGFAMNGGSKSCNPHGLGRVESQQ
jgi:hypothetical protein